MYEVAYIERKKITKAKKKIIQITSVCYLNNTYTELKNKLIVDNI